MYIVVHTMKPDGKDECSSYESDWSTHETFDEAEKEYQFLLNCPQIYTASICSVIESTDYDPVNQYNRSEVEAKISYWCGELDRLNADL